MAKGPSLRTVRVGSVATRMTTTNITMDLVQLRAFCVERQPDAYEGCNLRQSALGVASLWHGYGAK